MEAMLELLALFESRGQTRMEELAPDGSVELRAWLAPCRLIKAHPRSARNGREQFHKLTAIIFSELVYDTSKL